MSTLAKIVGFAAGPIVATIATKVVERSTQPKTKAGQYYQSGAVFAAVAAGAWAATTLLRGDSSDFAEGALWGSILGATVLGAAPLALDKQSFRDDQGKLLPANTGPYSMFSGEPRAKLTRGDLHALASEVR